MMNVNQWRTTDRGPGNGGRILPEALADLTSASCSASRRSQRGVVHGAAEALDYTQSAVSQHVAALEAALGVRLFERGRGRRAVMLTEAATLLLRHVTAIASRLQAARADLLAYAAGETRDAADRRVPSVGTRVLPAIMSGSARSGRASRSELSEAPTRACGTWWS